MEPPKSEAGSEHVDEQRDPFLSGPPRSGQLSTFAQKLIGEAFVLLASMVVFGSTINRLAHVRKCPGLCGYAIATGIISAIVTTLLVFGHFVTWNTKFDRGHWFTSVLEMRCMAFLVFWWGAGVGGLSAVTRPTASLHASGVCIFFGWLAFFGSIYTTFKAYHASKEEQRAFIAPYAFATAPEEEEHFANF